MSPEEAIKKTAESEGVSEEEVRAEIQKAIDMAKKNPDPNVQKMWVTKLLPKNYKNI